MATFSSTTVPRTVSARTRWAFGVGSAAETLSLYPVGILSMLYYNQVLGLEVLLAGLVPTISIFADAISDPLIGSLSDRWRSKRWGRRHPFMFIAPVPIALSFWCIFNPPEVAGWALFAWFLIWSILLRTFMTVYHVPHLAMGAELSKEYLERTAIMSYNNFFGWLGGPPVHKLNTVMFFAVTAQYGNALLNPEAYTALSVSNALAITLVLLASAWFTRDRIPTLPQPAPDAAKFSFASFFRDILEALRNRNYLFLLLALFALSLMLGVRGALNAYMTVYYWELSAAEFANILLIGSGAGYVFGFYFSARIHGRFDKRATIVATALLLSIFPAMPVILRLAGWFPDNGSAYLMWAIAAFGALGAASGSILNISVMSALADIADENAVRYGVRQEGVLYSARTFFAKLDASLGHGLAAIALAVIAFPEKAVPGEVEDDIVWWLGMIDSPLAIIPGIIAAALYAQYRINQAGYEKTRQALEVAEPTVDESIGGEQR